MLQSGLVLVVVSLAIACVAMYADAQHWAVWTRYFERYGDFVLIGAGIALVIGLVLVIIALLRMMG